jgi:arylsulfatase A-like enzyme
VCSPTRYGIMTGRYNWRSPLQHGVLGSLSPPLIAPARLTVPKLLKAHGYDTACIGKWHLGMGWQVRAGKTVPALEIESPEQFNNVYYDRPVTGGPNSAGFDTYFGISASLDMIPYAYLENERLIVPPSETKSFPMMAGRATRTSRPGPGAPGFEAEDVLPTLTRKAIDYIRQRSTATAAKGKPFFLYLPLNSPHAPIAPSREWLGRSGLKPYADFVMQTDWSVGEILRALDDAGLAENTIVMFTSDNGVTPQSDIPELVAKGHRSSYQSRGRKTEIYDGGHHIPLIVRWPARVAAGTTSDELVCLTDLMATCADILGKQLPDDAGEDSVSLLPQLIGKGPLRAREAIVHHSHNGSFAIRQGSWKLIFCDDAGASARDPAARERSDRNSVIAALQLFDLSVDVAERNNVVREHPDVVERLTRLMDRYVREGRSTPGARRTNDVTVEWEPRMSR